MGSKWKKVKAAIGLKFCLYVPKRSITTESSSSSAMVLATERRPSESESVNVDGRSSDVALLAGTQNSESRSSSVVVVSTTPRSSSLHRLTKSRSISSKKTCAICLGTMKAGQGHALFTAECSHSFHFHCIASNVKHGNQVCPICRAKWKDVPFQGPTSDLPNVRARLTLADLPQTASMNIRSQLPSRSNSNRRVASFPQPIEPAVFNDDDPLDCQPDLPNDDFSTRDVPDNTSIRSVEIKTYPEISAVQHSTSCPSFTALINLKAHVISLPDSLGTNQVNVPPISQNSHASVDLVTVLDISGSMTGTKLALLKRAMGFLIQNLGPSDRLSVIAFSSTASRLFPLRRMDDSGRQHALQAVNSLISNGGTNIVEGLRKGAKVMEDRRERNPVGSMMLLSDGQDTYTNGCVRNLGFQIPIHAFGFGADHDPVLMHSVAETSGGTFSFIEAEGVIQDAFAQCIGGLLSVVVQDLRILVECVQPNVRLGPVKTGSYATQVMNDSRTLRIDVGSLYADEERDFLVSVNVPVGDSSNETTLFNVRCSYKDPVSEEIKVLEGKEVRIQRPEVVRESVVSIEVDRQRNRLQAAEAMAASRRAAEQGDLANAVSGLESCRRLLSETISARAGDQFCAELDAELKEMQERMASRQVYETSGRAYLLSGLSSHTGQRATTRGDSSVTTYLTPSMSEMLSRSQVISLGIASSPPLNVPSFFLDEPQPR